MEEPLEPWTTPNQFVSAAILTELHREVADRHPLAGELGCGRGPGVLARCEACEVVCLALVGGAFAHVRLTWSARAEPLPFPATVLTGDATTNEHAMARHAATHVATTGRGTGVQDVVRAASRLG